MSVRRIDDSFESLMERVRQKVYRELDNHDPDRGEEYTDFYTVHTFGDVVVVRDEVSNKLYEVPYVRGDAEVYLGSPREVVAAYVQKRLEEVGLDIGNKSEGAELTGPIVFKNAIKRIAYAAVLVPGEPDHDGEIVTADKIEQSAHEWMAGYRNVDLQHTLNNVAMPVESYVLPMDMEVEAFGQKMHLPKGTWILASKVNDDTTWDRVEKGELTGYSVMGIRRTTLDTAMKNNEPEMALKKTLLQDLGPDWVAAAVSIVDEPAVPKAKFFALKSRDAEVKPKSWYDKLRDIFTPAEKSKDEDTAEKSGRRFSEDTYSKLKSAYDSLTDLIKEAEGERGNDESGSESFTDNLRSSSKSKEGEEDMKPEDIKVIIEEAVKSAVEPLQVEIQALKSAQAEKEVEVKEEEKAPDNNDELEAFKSSVIEKLEAIEGKVSKKSTTSKSLAGQDGDDAQVAGKSRESRDLYGRKREVK